MRRRSRLWWWRRGFLKAFLPLIVIWFAADAVTGRVPFSVAWKIQQAQAAGPTWSQAWQHYMNQQWAAGHIQMRMSNTHCALHAGVEICAFTVTGQAVKHGHACATALVDPTGIIVNDPKGDPYVHQIPCGEQQPPTHLSA